MRNHLLPQFGDDLLTSITPPRMAAWFSHYSKKHPGGANSTLALLRSVLNSAIAGHILPIGYANPCDEIRFNRKSRRHLILNDESLSRLGAALLRLADAMPTAVGIVRMLLYTGRSLSKVIGLSWAEIGEARRKPRNGPDYLLCTSPVMELLASHQPIRQTQEWLFADRRRWSRTFSGMREAWPKIRREAGLDEGVRLLDLKHTFAIHARMSGESNFIVGHLMGHKRLDTLDRYAMPLKIDLPTAAERIANAIAQSLDSEATTLATEARARSEFEAFDRKMRQEILESAREYRRQHPDPECCENRAVIPEEWFTRY